MLNGDLELIPGIGFRPSIHLFGRSQIYFCVSRSQRQRLISAAQRFITCGFILDLADQPFNTEVPRQGEIFRAQMQIESGRIRTSGDKTDRQAP
jgi:hypothetical protein